MENCIGHEKKIEVFPWCLIMFFFLFFWRKVPRRLLLGDCYFRVWALLLLDIVVDEETTASGKLLLFLQVGQCRVCK